MDELLDFMMKFLTDFVGKHGEFHPTAAVTPAKGEPHFVAGYLGEERPDPRELHEFLEGALRAMAAQQGLKAIAIASDVRMTIKDTGRVTDAICTHLEHRDGDTVEVLKPYAKKRLRGTEFGELVAQTGDRIVFV